MTNNAIKNNPLPNVKNPQEVHESLDQSTRENTSQFLKELKKSLSCSSLSSLFCNDVAPMHVTTPSRSLYDVVSTCPALNKPLNESNEYYDSLKDFRAGVNLFFGIGLGTPKGMSKGLPLDLLNMIFLAEGIGASKHVVIADETAKNNIEHSPDTFSEDKIEAYALQIEDQVQDIISALDLKDWNFVRESSIPRKEGMGDILQNIQLPKSMEDSILAANRDPGYFKQQYSGMAYFEKQENCAVKIGWCFGEKGAKEQFSEAGFDKEFVEASPGNEFGNLKFVYTSPGRTFDKTASRSSPYVSLDPSVRLMLLDTESQVHEKLTRMNDMRSTAKKKGRALFENFEKQVKSVIDTHNWLVDQGKIKSDKITTTSLEVGVNTLLARIKHQKSTKRAA